MFKDVPFDRKLASLGWPIDRQCLRDAAAFASIHCSRSGTLLGGFVPDNATDARRSGHVRENKQCKMQLGYRRSILPFSSSLVICTSPYLAAAA